MAISMKNILKKFDDCNKFSLTDFVLNDITIFDHKTKKYKYTISEEKIINNFQNVPKELRKHILSYKISSPDESSNSNIIDIKYYFELNDETKKYLLKFQNDYFLEPLEDLTLYKDDELKFWSCTHEAFNSIEIDYKNMDNEEIADFINDKYFNEDNSIIIEVINKLIKMPINNEFSFKELNVNDSQIINIILRICGSIRLYIVEHNEEDYFAPVEYEFNKEGLYEPLYNKHEHKKDAIILFKKIR